MDLIQKSYQILTWKNNPILRTKSDYIEEIDEEVRFFWNILLKLMRRYDWVWLAAPQVGKNIRMIATTQRAKPRKELMSETVMINPEIIEKSEKIITYEEACLSLPDLGGKVKRHENIVVKYTDLDWKEKIIKLKWFNSVIVQHEIDHLDGILFIDRAIKGSVRVVEE